MAMEMKVQWLQDEGLVEEAAAVGWVIV